MGGLALKIFVPLPSRWPLTLHDDIPKWPGECEMVQNQVLKTKRLSSGKGPLCQIQTLTARTAHLVDAFRASLSPNAGQIVLQLLFGGQRVFKGGNNNANKSVDPTSVHN